MNQDLLSILTLLLMAGAFYFLLIRPQQVRQRQHAEMVASLAPGDRVITAGGMIGTVVEVGETEIVVEVAEGVAARFAKDAVSRKLEG